jgi:hypothetical protein
MARIPFNVDAYTARLIGRENVSKLSSAILELVKNTYDADASVCFIYFDETDNALYIGDNGSGMTMEIIKKNWMTIGKSSKKYNYISQSGRIQTGAKGIGRFALDRIADKCTMMTISETERFKWSVDWRDFESESAITEVSAELTETEDTFKDFLINTHNPHIQNFVSSKLTSCGTVFKLTLLRDMWNSDRLDDIRKELVTLIPFELSQIFNIFLFDNVVGADAASVLHGDDDFSYDYKIEFDVDSDDLVKVNIWRNEFDFRNKFEHILKAANFSDEDREYFGGTNISISTTFSEFMTKSKNRINNSIGTFNGTLYFAKLQQTKDDREKFYYKDIPDRRLLRESFGGIKIYRDQFRVRPYGDPSTSNYDWLQLSSRKNSSPAAVASSKGSWRVRGDQMVGSVYISRINVTLPDQANREGIVETAEFGMLKAFLINIIQLFERDRQYVFRKLNDLFERESETEKYQKEISEKASAKKEHKGKDNNKSILDSSQADSAVDARKAQQVIEAKERIIQNLEDENRMLSVLATTGISTNAYMHEFKAQTHKLGMKIIMAKEALELDYDQDEALKQLLLADKIRISFSSWFGVTVESVRRDKRKLKSVDLCALLDELCGAWQLVLSDKGITIAFSKPENPIYFRCFPYEIEVIVNNLVTNSSGIFETYRNTLKEINIEICENDSFLELVYSDTGPGLASEYKKDPEIILEPFESDKTNGNGERIGTGMGMWLINRTVSAYNGIIDLSRNSKEPTGFYCNISLPQKA